MTVAPGTPRQPARRPPPAAGPATYVLLPVRLLEDLRRAPAAIGAYALLGRLALAGDGGAHLSPNDLRALDPALSYGAARRALIRLEGDGYVAAERRRGHKARYTPTWGVVAGAARGWEHAAPLLGCPRHVATIRLDDRLLDLCLGRLRPHPELAARVSRYVVEPLLSLRDIGLYALALAGIPAASPGLSGLGLLGPDGRTRPLPDDATVLAVASQRQPAAGLTPAGWRRAGLPPADPPPQPGRALFFVPPEVIGEVSGPVIGPMIAPPAPADAPPGPSGSPPEPQPAAAAGSHGSTDSDGEKRDSTTSTGPRPAGPGGGGAQSSRRPSGGAARPGPATTGPAAPPAAPPDAAPQAQPCAAGRSGGAPPDGQAGPPAHAESLQLLRAIGVRADVAGGLARHAPEPIRRLIAQARARPGVRDLAAWVVSALRALPAAEEQAPPAPRVSERAILFHPRLSGYDRQRWLARFRGSDPADRPAVLARFHAEHPLEEPHVADP